MARTMAQAGCSGPPMGGRSQSLRRRIHFQTRIAHKCHATLSPCLTLVPASTQQRPLAAECAHAASGCTQEEVSTAALQQRLENTEQPQQHISQHDLLHHWQQQLQQQQQQSPPSAQDLATSPRKLHTAAALAAAAALLMLQTQRQMARIGRWCRRHRLQELLWGTETVPALAAMAVLPVLPGGGLSDLFTNRVFLAGFWGWFTAQTLKIFTKRLKKGVWDIRAIVDSGGMPSSHSALCAGITTAIAFQNGLGSSAFALAVAFSSIVMYDAAGVRRHAGKQAEVLNQVIDELLEGHPVSDIKLKEVLGHTPLQVCAGAVLGVLFGIFYPMPDAAATAAARSAQLLLA